MNKKYGGIALTAIAGMLLCPLFGLLFVGYDKMMVHNAGSAAEEQGTMALLSSGCCCLIIGLLGMSGVFLMLSKPKPEGG